MKPIHKRLFATTILALSVGALAIVPVVNSDNGYVAGYVFFPLLCLIGLAAFILFVAGLVTIVKGPGPYLLLASIMLLAGFFGAAFVAKSLELGAYQEQPMRPIAEPIANKVLFKKEASHEEVERFWSHVIGYPTGPTSHWSIPGVGGGFRPGPERGHEVIVFSFRPEATEEEKDVVRERIRNYLPVYQFLENVDTRPTETPEPDIDNTNTKKPVKTPQIEPSNLRIVR